MQKSKIASRGSKIKNGKIALITGASSGFGLEFARLFAKDGYNIIITARPGTELESIAKKIRDQYHIQVYPHNIDLSGHMAAQKLYQWVKCQEFHVNCLINNAGIGNFGRFAENSLEREHELLELNIVSLAELCHQFIPDMIAAGGGKILNVASIAAFQPGPYYATYFASKAFVLLFSEALALEYAKDNIIVTALCPGVSRTNFFKRARMTETSPMLQLHLKNADFVAKIGYRGLMKGSRIVIPGLRNKLIAKSYRILPRSTLAHMTKKLVEIASKG